MCCSIGCSILKNSCPAGVSWSAQWGVWPLWVNKSELGPVWAGSHLSVIMTRNLSHLNDLLWPVSLRSHSSPISKKKRKEKPICDQGRDFRKNNCYLEIWQKQNKQIVIGVEGVKWVTAEKQLVFQPLWWLHPSADLSKRSVVTLLMHPIGTSLCVLKRNRPNKPTLSCAAVNFCAFSMPLLRRRLFGHASAWNREQNAKYKSGLESE